MRVCFAPCLCSVSRVFARLSKEEARRLIRSAPYVRRFLRVRADAVELLQPAAFEKLLADMMRQDCHTKLAAAGGKSSGPSPRKCEIALRRRLASWARSQPRARLRGIITEDGEVTDQDGGAARAGEALEQRLWLEVDRRAGSREIGLSTAIAA